MFRRFNLHNLKLQNLIFYAIAAYIVVMIVMQQSSLDNQRQRYEEAQSQLQAAEQYNAELQAQRDYIGTDEYKKELAYEEGYVEDDEIVFEFGYEEN